MPRPLFSKLCSSLLCAYCSNKLQEWGPTQARLCLLSIMQLRAWAHQRSAYTQLSPLYLLSTFSLPSDKLFQALSHFSVLQVAESWAGPGNKASISPFHPNLTFTHLCHKQVVKNAKIVYSYASQIYYVKNKNSKKNKA